MLPQLADAFDWIHTSSGPAIVCRPLLETAAHLFTTRHWRLGAGVPPDDEAAWAEVAAAIGVAPAQLVHARQVHGRDVVIAHVPLPATLPEGDIIIGDDRTLAPAVRAADCVPLLLADRRTGAVAAAHAGWRGLAAGVPGVAVERLVAEFGCRPADLVAAIGPAIGACCYEVGDEVRATFQDAAFPGVHIAHWFSRRAAPSPQNPSMPGLPSEPREHHWFFDGWQCARDQLESAGIPRSRVFAAGTCTASHPDVFCSYRRDGKRAGRLVGVIRPGKGTGARPRP
jgi:polyphenol oxidase